MRDDLSLLALALPTDALALGRRLGALALVAIALALGALALVAFALALVALALTHSIGAILEDNGILRWWCLEGAG